MFTKQDIEKYFVAEKQLGLLFVIIGAAAIVIGIIFLLLLKTPFHKGAAIPLVILGLLQLAAGFAVFKKSDSDKINIVHAYDSDHARLKNLELPRMKKVLVNFSRVKWLEAALIITGLALIFFYRADPGRAFWYGLGLTLAIQVLITLVADYSAERRAVQYTMGLERFLQGKSNEAGS